MMPIMDKQAVADAIKERLSSLADQELAIGNSAAAVELDQSRVGRLSRMDALQSQAMQTETLRRIKLQVTELNRAMTRIDHEDFGFCENCSQEIASARLALNPAARLCIACAELAENG